MNKTKFTTKYLENSIKILTKKWKIKNIEFKIIEDFEAWILLRHPDSREIEKVQDGFSHEWRYKRDEVQLAWMAWQYKSNVIAHRLPTE